MARRTIGEAVIEPDAEHRATKRSWCAPTRAWRGDRPRAAWLHAIELEGTAHGDGRAEQVGAARRRNRRVTLANTIVPDADVGASASTVAETTTRTRSSPRGNEAARSRNTRIAFTRRAGAIVRGRARSHARSHGRVGRRRPAALALCASARRSERIAGQGRSVRSDIEPDIRIGSDIRVRYRAGVARCAYADVAQAAQPRIARPVWVARSALRARRRRRRRTSQEPTKCQGRTGPVA